MLTINVYNSHAEMQYLDTLECKTFIDTYLKAEEVQKRMSRGKNKTFKVTTVEHNLFNRVGNKVIFPRGIVDYIKHLGGIEFNWFGSSNIVPPVISEDEIAKVLKPEADFYLREDQVVAVRKCLYLKRGLIQMPPGSGKTEVQSAVLKILFSNNKNIKALVIEPTTELSKSTVKRFNNYDLNATFYSDVRNTDSDIVVAHVSALLNDLDCNSNLLKEFNVVIFDEAHHKLCSTWLKLNFALEGAEYSLGFSALAIDEKNTDKSRYPFMSYPEKLIALSTGAVILHLNPSYYIDDGYLSTPIVFQLNNIISPSLNGEKVWVHLFAEGISSEDRNTKIVDSVLKFLKYGRKILILVGTKSQAFDISDGLLNHVQGVGISLGGGESYVDGEKYNGDLLDNFNEGVYNVLLATTHLDEGVDIKNLDVCVLASGGKKDRRLIQRLGRVLRKTKTGKYAYIIDFSDAGNFILSRHSNSRMKLYRELIEIPEENIFSFDTVSQLEDKFRYLEEI